MKLDKEQLITIRDFVSDRGFTYYDVQLEIIDHVACKVEALMTADPALTLDTAIANTHAGFGVMGFSVVEDAMKVSLQKRYWKLFCSTYVSYLKPLYLPLYAGGIYLIYVLSKNFSSTDLPGEIALGMGAVMIIPYLLTSYRQRRKYKRMLTAQMGGMVVVMVNVPMQLLTWIARLSKNIPEAGIIAVIMGMATVAIIITFLTLLKMQKIAFNNCRELEEQYQLTIGI